MRRPIITFFAGVIVGLFLFFGFSRIVALVSGEDLRIYRGFNAIKLSMPRQDVVNLMGSEGRRSDTFHLGQLQGFEIEYRTASRIGAAYFLSWHTGVDMVFTVAFDEHDKAIYKASGGT